MQSDTAIRCSQVRIRRCFRPWSNGAMVQDLLGNKLLGGKNEQQAKSLLGESRLS